MKSRILIRPLNKAIGCLLFLLISACQENILYHSYQPVNNAGWYRSDTLTYLLDSCITNIDQYEYQVGVRFKDSYLYQDIWLGLLPIRKDSVHTIQTDTLHIYLSDSTGHWKGQGIGETRQISQRIDIHSRKSNQDTIIGFQIIHLMKDRPLQGIIDLGVRIKSLNESYGQNQSSTIQKEE